jgi:transposase
VQWTLTSSMSKETVLPLQIDFTHNPVVSETPFETAVEYSKRRVWAAVKSAAWSR